MGKGAGNDNPLKKHADSSLYKRNLETNLGLWPASSMFGALAPDAPWRDEAPSVCPRELQQPGPGQNSTCLVCRNRYDAKAVLAIATQ